MRSGFPFRQVQTGVLAILTITTIGFVVTSFKVRPPFDGLFNGKPLPPPVPNSAVTKVSVDPNTSFTYVVVALVALAFIVFASIVLGAAIAPMRAAARLRTTGIVAFVWSWVLLALLVAPRVLQCPEGLLGHPSETMEVNQLNLCALSTQQAAVAAKGYIAVALLLTIGCVVVAYLVARLVRSVRSGSAPAVTSAASLDCEREPTANAVV